MNLNPTIDIFSQHFNNVLPRFMSTSRRYREIAIDTINKVWMLYIWIARMIKKCKSRIYDYVILTRRQLNTILYVIVILSKNLNFLVKCRCIYVIIGWILMSIILKGSYKLKIN